MHQVRPVSFERLSHAYSSNIQPGLTNPEEEKVLN
jgi:hypothetical protein